MSHSCVGRCLGGIFWTSDLCEPQVIPVPQWLERSPLGHHDIFVDSTFMCFSAGRFLSEMALDWSCSFRDSDVQRARCERGGLREAHGSS